jgi:glutamine amidotransferase
MQMLATVSEEFGEHTGLGLVPGRVVAIPDAGVDGRPHKIPQIGWTALRPAGQRPDWENSILADTVPGDCVYLVHSFAVVPSDVRHRLADCDYDGHAISAAIMKDNISGCQFHPEKSGRVGLTILKRFLS